MSIKRGRFCLWVRSLASWTVCFNLTLKCSCHPALKSKFTVKEDEFFSTTPSLVGYAEDEWESPADERAIRNRWLPDARQVSCRIERQS
ncbi:BgTH12-01099 [Blumeria graminis f. sp. triticale]|uniref:BgTH12-01099 n=1 Tax=Blumeria graminis f. sp. triticale TaxID=1689686 RepID=A0A9W4D7T2_BLUGR|nr:BgTH12-01099 [Blumeria graminis f. sp. triticale]